MAAASGDEDTETRDLETRPAKRHRITLACKWCREKKSRCNGVRPRCATCEKHGIECHYEPISSLSKSAASKEYLETLVSRLSLLEGSVSGLQTRVSRLEGEDTESVDSGSSPHVQARDKDDMNHDLQELDPTDGIGSIEFTKESESGFFGPSSNIALTRQIVRAATSILRSVATVDPVSPIDVRAHSHMLHVSRPQTPRTETSKHSHQYSPGTEPFILPDTADALALVDLFFATTGMLFPYIDRQELISKYHQLISTNLRTARKSWLGLLNMVLAMATSASSGGPFSACERSGQSDTFFRRAMRICDQEIRHGTSLETIQVLLLMSQYLQGTERSIETWNLHGLAVKAAYQLGLHSPSSLKQYSPREREMRTRTWFACIMLDRTLSMTMGRPCAIPENFVRLELPSPLPASTISSPGSITSVDEVASTSFFVATITLYRIMGEIVDALYGSNLGVDPIDGVYETTSHTLRMEQQFHAWQQNLSPDTPLIQSGYLAPSSQYSDNLRFQVILTLRYLNVRILAHRPLLCQYLEALSNPTVHSQQLSMLRSVGTNSVQTCVESAMSIIRLMRSALDIPTSPRHLLGAWWFSLYYAFNAALIIFGALLLQHQAIIHNEASGLKNIELGPHNLHEAIECLSKLNSGNRMTEKCVRYTTALAHILNDIQNPGSLGPSAPISNTPFNAHSLQQGQSSHLPLQAYGFADFDSTDLHIGMDINDLFSASTFTNMPHFGNYFVENQHG